MAGRFGVGANGKGEGMENSFAKISNHRGRLVLGSLFTLVLGFILGFYSTHQTSFSSGSGGTDTSSHLAEVKPPVQYAHVAETFGSPQAGGPETSPAEEEITGSRRNAIVLAVETVQPAVVSVSVTQVRVYQVSPFSVFFNDPFFDQFFPELKQEYRQKIKSLGSGFIVNDTGYILTNEHVVHNAVKVVVNLPDGRQFDAELIDSDRPVDIAVLKVPGKNLPFAKLGNSDDVLIGEWAIALGNPLGYVNNDARPTVTVGVISALNRDFQPQQGRVYRNMIQTDASINPGNSGGPLVNALGEVIGINTFILTHSGGSEGIGFAIPINKAKRILDEVLKYNKIRDFWTGLTVQDIDLSIAQSLGLKSPQGVIVVEVAPKSPAEEAGIRVGDVILQVNETPTKNRSQIQAAFAGGMVGDIYHLVIFRKGKKLKIDLTLEERPKR